MSSTLLSMPLPVGREEAIRERAGERLREARERLGLTQREVSIRADIDQMTVSRAERGLTGDLGTLSLIARTLDVYLGDLFKEPEEELSEREFQAQMLELVVDLRGRIARLEEHLLGPGGSSQDGPSTDPGL